MAQTALTQMLSAARSGSDFHRVEVKREDARVEVITQRLELSSADMPGARCRPSACGFQDLPGFRSSRAEEVLGSRRLGGKAQRRIRKAAV